MKLFIFTLNWNGADLINVLHGSLLPNLKKFDWTWVIRDNGSTDNSADLIKSFNNKNIHLLKIGHNRDNYSKGMNFLSDYANAGNDDYILHLNNDIKFNDNTSIQKMVDLMDNDADIGQVGAKLNYAGSSKIQHCGVVFDKKFTLPIHLDDGVEESDRHRRNRYMSALTGAVCLNRASILKKARMDEKFLWCFDDIDLNLQIGYLLGKKLVYCGGTNISHHSSISLKKNPINRLFLQQNARNFLFKWKNYIIKNGDLNLLERYNDLNFRAYK